MEHDPDWDETLALVRAANAKGRGYADYWEWAPDRSLAERGVVAELAEYLSFAEGRSWRALESVEHDPPDVLLISTCGAKVGVEVTELVDPETVKRHRHRKRASKSQTYDWAPWTTEKLSKSLTESIERKDKKLAAISKNYDEIMVIAFTDEPLIDLTLSESALKSCMPKVMNIDRAFLLLSYHPAVDKNLYPSGIPVLSVNLAPAKAA